MIFDHGVRVFDGATRARFKAIMDGAPNCSVCPKEPAVGMWLNPRNGHMIPMCMNHLVEYTEDDEETR